ncbi:MAG: hypothetical protein F7C07_06020 [Desulfurococcales archaeon]|nr:hypothetical protein [Desulfurococcales archaeon]
MVEEKVGRFEREYGMSSSEFLERYGKLKFLERIRGELEELKKIADRLSRKIPSES